MKLIKHSSGLLEANIKKDEFEIVWISDLHFDSKYSMWGELPTHRLCRGWVLRSVYKYS